MRSVLFVATPGGRVVLKPASALSESDAAAVAEYRRNEEPDEDGSLGGSRGRLRIDRERLDLSTETAIPLKGVPLHCLAVPCLYF